jgi:hypothetical protein
MIRKYVQYALNSHSTFLENVERKKESLRRESSTVGVASNLEFDGALDLGLGKDGLRWLV